MKVLVTGSSGLLGSATLAQLTAAGHFVVRLVRRDPDLQRGDVFWDPVAGRIERNKLEGLDAVVHLAGESIFGLWTGKKRSRIHRSRVAASEFLAETLVGLTHRPRVIVAASASGYYGDRGAEWLSEREPPGAGFLAQTCQEWEQAWTLATTAGLRVVNLRFGIVLSPKGGALSAMLPIFKIGLGGRQGSGRQYMSWITIQDALRIIQFSLDQETLSGPVNAAAPEPVTNSEFTVALGRALRRTALFHVPGVLLRLLPGHMAQEILLASVRMKPDRLRESGFRFDHPQIDEALRHVLT